MIKPRVGALVNKQKMSLLVLFVVGIFVGAFCCENTYAYGQSGIVNELGSSQYILNTMGELQVKYQDEFAQNNIMFYDPSTSCTSSNLNGCNFKKYNYSEADLKQLAAVAACENGGEGLKKELSLMANLFELNGKGYSSVLDYVMNSPWFSCKSTTISASSEQVKTARDVFNNGNRVLPPEVNEHDCIDCGEHGYDIEWIKVNGRTISDHEGLKNSKNYIKGKTVLHNRYDSTYTFYDWADPKNPVNSDPMGYTKGPISCDPNNSDSAGDSSSPSSSSTTGTKSSKNKYPQYFQRDYNDPYPPGSGNTIADSGCGAASMAMLTSFVTGKKVTPVDVANITETSPYYRTIGEGMTKNDKKVCEKYGCEVKNIKYGSKNEAVKLMKKYLGKGYSIHLSGAGSLPFSPGGHYIGIFDIEGDDVMVANSAYKGNTKMKLKSVVNAGMHGGAFAIIKGNGKTSSDDNDDACDEDNESVPDNDVLKSVEEIIKLANKNGSTYTLGGGHTNKKSVFDAMLSGAPINVDCTGFVSLVMYKTFGKMTTFSSEDIASNSQYKKVSRSDVQPGDIAIYHPGDNPGYSGGHGAVVIEVKNGEVTKVAETGGIGGRSGKNKNIGYSYEGHNVMATLRIVNGPNGEFYRWKGK